MTVSHRIGLHPLGVTATRATHNSCKHWLSLVYAPQERLSYTNTRRTCSASNSAGNSGPLHSRRSFLSSQRLLSLESGMVGPLPDTPSLPRLHVNRFGVIPKGHNTGKWRLITDLSFPQGSSVNDGIDATLCSLAYTTVDEVASLIAQFPPGALLAKIDIESAYRLIPVHPQDRWLQTVKWEGKMYVDPMLPFGLRLAPKIFNAVSDALNWYLHRCGIHIIRHYLDDFIIVAPPQSSICEQSIAILNRECARLGVPIADHKRDGPTTCLTFLGIEIDTMEGQLHLPDEKLSRLQAALSVWGDRKTCSRKELKSLIGLLNHACKVVRSGRSFLRRMIDLLHGVQRPTQSKKPFS